jgi:hypothetical protein
MLAQGGVVLGEKEIEELKAQHGEKLEAIIDDSTGDTVAVVRPPTGGEWDRLQAMMLDDDQRAHAMKTLVRACLVWPGGDILKERPALVLTIGSQLREMAGAVKAVSRKKL